jgi:YVTN family beta-propeller protein
MKFLLLLLIFLLQSTLILSAKVGDEKYALDHRGHFYVFAAGQILIIDPMDSKIVKTLGDSSYPLIWGDSVFAVDKKSGKRYMFSADRTSNSMYVIDTEKMELVSKIPVGNSPVHIYFVEHRNEIWSRADGEGNFDVISLEDVTKLAKADVTESPEVANKHGKLIYDEELNGVGYITNTQDQGIYKFNLDSTAAPVFLNFTESNTLGKVCKGTHGIAYSNVNQHLFVECTGSTGTWEFDTKTGSVVAVYDSIFGQLFSSPDDRFVFAVNGNQAKIEVFSSALNGAQSNQPYHDISFSNSKISKIAFTPESSYHNVSDVKDWIVWATLNDGAQGVGWADIGEVLNTNGQGVLSKNFSVLAAGSGSSTRNIKAGGRWVAVESAVPKSLFIVDAYEKAIKSSISLPNVQVFRISWASSRYYPPACTSSSSGLDSSSVAGLSVGLVILGFILGALVVVFGYRRKYGLLRSTKVAEEPNTTELGSS